MAKKNEEIYLIDGSSYIYRAYHAMGGLSNSKGFPTNAIFGFCNMLAKTMRDRSPKRIAVIFDARGPNFRYEIYPSYKANRPPTPDDLQIQIPRIHEIVEAYRIPSISIPGFEADDIIAALSRLAADKGWKVTIVSGDKDLTQLVSDGISMWDPQRDVTYDPEGVSKKFGVFPEQMLDFLALVGDSSDNIPGVSGIGPKKAIALLQEFGSLEGIYANIDRVTQKGVKEKLADNKDNAFLSRKLAELRFEVPLTVQLEDLVVLEQDSETLREIFKELEFKKLLEELPARRCLDYSGYCCISTMEELLEWIETFKRVRRFAVDLETTSTEPMRAKLVGLSFCAEGGKACYLPVGHTQGSQLNKDEVLAVLRPILEDETILKFGQNIKYDMIVLQREGITVKGVVCDTMLASYLLDPSRRGHSLDDLAESCLEHRTIKITELIGTGKNQILFSEVDIDNATKYACEDAEVTCRVADILCPRLEAEGLTRLMNEVELPLIPVLVDMEIAGVRIDIPYLMDLSREFGEMLKSSEDAIYEMAGEPFNINSPKQLAEILFKRLGLKGVKKTKTGLSTSLEVLEELALEHELPRLILGYRSIYKLKSTYVDSLVTLVNPETGRIHTSYNQAVAATGRLSSSDPNLQNIPIRSTEGRKIRAAFIPDDGYAYVAADYSQIELRLVAHISGDERLRQAFIAGEDIHAITAADVFGCSIAQVVPEMRRRAKEINFGIIYGMGPFKLAGRIGVGLKMAKQYLEDYYRTYAGVRQYMEEVPEKAKLDGYVTTILGRKRFLPDLNNPNKIAQQAAKRMAVNTTIQGSAADIIKLAMIRVHDALKKNALPARMILQVHDELVLEVREDAAQEAQALLKKEMEHVYPLSIPLVVDTAIGKNWDEAH
jgi:DNA polymerase-1